MKRLILTLLAVGAFLPFLSAQVNFDDVVVRERKLTCADISETASNLFVQYMKANQNDSVQYLLNYWKANCGESEPVFRAHILYALCTNKYLPENIQDNAVPNLFYYQMRWQAELPDPNVSSSILARYDYVFPQGIFDQYTLQLADSIATHDASLGEYERHWAKYYASSSDFIFTLAASPQYAFTPLGRSHRSTVDDLISSLLYIFGVGVGGYFPLGSMRALTPGATLDMNWGVRRKQLTWMWNFAIGPITTPRTSFTYLAPNGSTYSADIFTRVATNIDLYYHFNRPYHNNFYAQAGVGFEVNNFVSSSDASNNKAQGVTSPRVSLGAGYQINLKNTYLDFNVRYNYADYSYFNRTNLRGGYISTSLTWNMVGNTMTRDILRRIKYLR